MFNLKSAAIGAAMCIAAASLTTGSAHATLLSVDDSTGVFGTPGSGAVTFDDVNMLEWLDLTFSTNRFFADTTTQFGAGGAFVGWRHASELEVIALFTAGGFPPGSYDPATQLHVNLIAQLGGSIASGPAAPGFPAPGPDFRHRAFGYYASGLFAILDLTRNFADSIDGLTVAVGSIVPDQSQPFIGHWIVRAPLPPTAAVPEPSAVILFATGVFLLGAVRRRKRVV